MMKPTPGFEPGKDADVMILDQGLNVMLTMVRGEMVYKL